MDAQIRLSDGTAGEARVGVVVGRAESSLEC